MSLKDNGSGGLSVIAFFWIALLVSCILSKEVHSAPLLDRVVAVVNKEVITWSELYRAMEFEMMSGAIKSVSDAEKKKLFKENETAFLDSMIDRKLQLQVAGKLDIDASKEEIADAIEGIKKKYSMDEKEFRDSLTREGFSYEEYRKRLAEHIILSKLVGQQVRNRIAVSDAEVDSYVAENKDSHYRVRQIFLKKSEKNGDTKAIEERAGEVMQRLKNGEDFSALARIYSEDPTGKAGGDLGYVKSKDLGKEFVEVLSPLKEGEVSRPFWTGKGLHIIKLEEKMDGKNMDELRESVKKKLFEKRFEEEYRSWIRSLRERAFVEVRL
jgi:peptidyl-prolyl cis-trans isomerase SurA